MKASARIDARSETLVQDVQSYSNPTGRPPTPTTEASPEPHSFAEPELPGQTGPDRLATPEWFVPRADSLIRSEDNADDVPAVSEDIQLPSVSPAEEQIISTAGVEALAYYAPFHFYQRHQWGIYIRDFGLAYLASRFLGRHTVTAADNWVLRCAYEFLFQHEYSHFQAEVAVSRYELLLFQKTIYLDHVYLRHFSDRHSSWLEESVANARAYGEFEHRIQPIASQGAINQFKSFLTNWMKCQPPGYRDYHRWKGRTGLKRGRSAMATHLHESVEHWRRGAIKNDGDILDLFRDAEYSRIPVTRIPDARLAALRSARQFPKAYGLQVSVFSNDHPPPHVHVDFLDGNPTVRVEWPSLQPLRHDRPLSRSERSNLGHYLKLHQQNILHKLRIVFGSPTLPPAIA
jgi:hypothetical protein